MTVSMRNFMNAKHNGDDAILWIFSSLLQRQRIQLSFMNDSIKTFKRTKQPTKQTQTNNQSDNINDVVVHALTTPTTQTLEYSSSKFIINWTMLYISSITNLYTSSISKNLCLACSAILDILSISNLHFSLI